ncbi:MAG: hypothetical protein AB1522_10170 [Chloroflexota bacterium]
MSKIRRLKWWFVIVLAIAVFWGGAYLAGSFVTASAADITASPSDETLSNFETLRKFEAKLDETIRQEGWLRYRYQQLIVETNPYFSSSGQMPARAEFEMWFHFNREGWVDQQVTFLIQEGEKILTEVYKDGIYRSMAEDFQPIEQPPFSPSFYFYLTREDPQLAAQEGVVLEISTNRRVEEMVIPFEIERRFIRNAHQNSTAEAMKHVLWVDSASGQPLRIENYRMLSDGSLRLIQSITQIDFARFDDLPVDVQKVFVESTFDSD